MKKIWTDIQRIDFGITSYCNIKCSGCLRQTSEFSDLFNNTTHLDINLIKSKINKKRFPNLKAINYCGGIDEPVMHPKFEEWVDWGMETSNDIVTASTNGSVRNKNFWKRLGEKYPYKKTKNQFVVTFALDGVDNETLNLYRKGSNYKKVLENALAFIEGGGRATWQFIRFDWNEHQYDKAKQLAKDYGFTRFKEIHSQRSHIEKGKYNKEKKFEETKQIECRFGVNNKIHITHNAIVSPCCWLSAFDIEIDAFKNKFTPPKMYYELEQYYNFLKDRQFEINNSLKYNDLEDILNGNFYDIEKNIISGTPLPTCEKRCRKNKRNLFVNTNLDNGNVFESGA